MEKLMDEFKFHMKKRKPMVLIGGSIFASAIFVGSAVLFQSDESVGLAGMIGSGIDNGDFCIV